MPRRSEGPRRLRRLLAAALLVCAPLAACRTTTVGQPAAGPQAANPATTPSLGYRARQGKLRFRPVTQQVAATPGGGGPATGVTACWGVDRTAAAQLPPAGSPQWNVLVDECVGVRQSTDPATQQAALRALTCGPAVVDVLAGGDAAALPLVTCDQQGTAKYLLGPAFLDGTQVRTAAAGRDPNGTGYVINLTFTSLGAKTWADYTSRNIGTAVAFALDTRVLSAPTINEGILDGNTQISGRFTQQEAQRLADELTGR